MSTFELILKTWWPVGAILWLGMVVIILVFLKGSGATLNKEDDKDEK